MNDTSLHIEEQYNQMLMSRSGEERLKMGCSMHATAKKMVRASLLYKNPQATENSIQQELFLRFYANDFDPDTQKKILQAIETYPIS
jgi:hypothetical protein